MNTLRIHCPLCIKLLKNARKSDPIKAPAWHVCARSISLSPRLYVDSVQTTKPLFPDTMLHIYCLKGHPPQVSDGPGDFLGTWQEDGYSFLFFLQPRQRFVDTLLETHGELELTDYLTMTYRQWQGDFVEPLKIGRFVLTPPWLKR
ncbi:MAG: hypothetical protein WBW79_07985, partial [Desulfocapsaceae bacterium]